MPSDLPYELISNLASVILLILLGLKYLKYKEKVDIVKNLATLKDNKSLKSEDKEYIKANEKEYRTIIMNSEKNVQLANPILIFLIALLFLFFPLQEAMIHANVIVVAFIFIHVDKLHKKNIYKFLYELKQELKQEELKK